MGPRSGDWLRSVLFWLPNEFALLPLCRFHRRMATTSAGAWASLRHSICFSWRGRWPGGRCTLALDGRDFRVAGVAWAAYAAVALPLGLLTGFLTWHPAVDVAGLLATPVLIYTLTAVPEEFLFRGVIQNL